MDKVTGRVEIPVNRLLSAWEGTKAQAALGMPGALSPPGSWSGGSQPTTFPGDFPGSTAIKKPPASAGDARDSGWISGSGRSPGVETTPVFLPGIFHGQRSLVGFRLWGCRVRQEWITEHARARAHTHTHTHTFSFPLRMTVSTFIYETATPITSLTSSFLFPYEEALPWKQIKHTRTDKHSRVNETSLQVSSTSILLAPTKTSDTVLLMRGDPFTGAWLVFCYLLVIWFHFWAETGEEYKRK